MKTYYVDDDCPEEVPQPSVFLAGPTPRLPFQLSWRPEALKFFEDFNGAVYVPERSDWQSNFEYYEQTEWEWKHLHGCTAILFWIPRKIPDFPAFTTNVEFGFYIDKKPCVYGRPKDAEKTRYLDWLFEKVTSRKPFDTLEESVKQTIELALRGQS